MIWLDLGAISCHFARMKPDIKICGLKTPETIERAVARGASHIGFIFFEKSPRYIEPADAAEAVAAVRGKAKIVAVVVDPTNDDLDEIVSLLKPDLIQLHGNEAPDRVLEVKMLYGLPVMKVFSVRDADDLRRIDSYIGIADRFLFDAKAPKGSELPGGNGVSFDWTLMKQLDENVNYMLSGGLNKDNVAAALAMTRARGLDVSSGVEEAPGVKNIDMIDGFFDAVAKASRPSAASGS